MATIGIDITPLCNPFPGGIGSCLYETLRALERMPHPHTFVLFGTGQPYVPFTEEYASFPWPLRVGTGLSARSNIVWFQTGLVRMLHAEAADLFWGTRYTLPVRGRFKKVVTVHDFWYAFHPEQQPWLNLTLNRVVTRSAVRHADRVAAISEATAEDARRLFPERAGRIAVAELGVDATHFAPASAEAVAVVRDRLGIAAPYVLAMDVYNPRKNAEGVLRAFAQLPADVREGLTLVALGRPRRTARPVPIEALAAELGIADRVALVGDVEYADLPPLYAGAAALAFPSVYEGFGMPVLEAMASGCPVVTSSVSSLPEVAGDAALLVDPADPATLAAALERLVRDAATADALRAAGLERAAAFTWEHTARRMLELFDEALASR